MPVLRQRQKPSPALPPCINKKKTGGGEATYHSVSIRGISGGETAPVAAYSNTQIFWLESNQRPFDALARSRGASCTPVRFQSLGSHRLDGVKGNTLEFFFRISGSCARVCGSSRRRGEIGKRAMHHRENRMTSAVFVQVCVCLAKIRFAVQ